MNETQANNTVQNVLLLVYLYAFSLFVFTGFQFRPLWYDVSGWVLLIRRILHVRLFHKTLPIRIHNLMINPKQTRRSNRNRKTNCTSIYYTSNVNSYLKLKLMYCEPSEPAILNLARHRLIKNAVAWGVPTRGSVDLYKRFGCA